MGMGSSLCALALLLWLDSASSDRPPGLLCLTDYVNTITCAWRGPAQSPGANCSIYGRKRTWRQQTPNFQNQSCRMAQHGNSPPGCSITFQDTGFNQYSLFPFIKMECDGALVENLTDYQPRKHVKMNPPGAPAINATANYTWISWEAGVWSKYTNGEFHAQIKKQNQLWEEAKDLNTQQLKVNVHFLEMIGTYEVRVRVRPIQPPKNYWSDWSPTTSYFGMSKRVSNNKVSERFLNRMTLMMGLGFSAGIVCAVMLGLYTGYLRKRVNKKRPVPNPSKYFCTIQSLYEGNLKAWLNPTEAFFATQAIDSISSVEVCGTRSAYASLPLSFFPAAPMQLAGSSSLSSSSSSSSYSNMGYFLSSLSGDSAQKPLAPTYFKNLEEGESGKADRGVSLCPFSENSRSYKSLEQEPQSPDSGFSFRKEEDEETEDAEGPGDQICPLLVLPLWHPPPRSPPCPPPNGDPPLDLDNDGGGACRSSSTNAQPCRTGYLTLKELHMTFSNKSI